MMQIECGDKYREIQGMILVISGVDGAGKSTVVEAMSKKLSVNQKVRCISLGKPQGMLLERLRARFRKGDYGHSKKISREYRKDRIIKDAIPSIVLGLLRLRLSRKARRIAQSGTTIISDRWPTLERGKMDGPKIAMDIPGVKGFVLHFLARLESSIYKKIEPCDIAFHLVVDERTAVLRNSCRLKAGKESTEDIIRRHRDNMEFYPVSYRFEYIDNNGSLEDVLRVLEERVKVCEHEACQLLSKG